MANAFFDWLSKKIFPAIDDVYETNHYQASMLEHHPSKYPGFFVAVEGIDGSGKTDLVKSLSEFTYPVPHTSSNDSVFVTRAPGGSKFGESIRESCRSSEITVTTQALAYSASIIDCWETNIIPELEKGKLVVSDRFFGTTFAYQGIFGEKHQLILDILKNVPGYRHPDLTIYLNLPLEVSMQRSGIRVEDTDRFSKFNKADKEATKEVYDLLYGVDSSTHYFNRETVHQVSQEFFNLEKDFIPEHRIAVLDATMSQRDLATKAWESIVTAITERNSK